MEKRRVYLTFATLLYAVLPLTAQMSGTYTLGGSKGLRNFTTWSDFVSEWNKNGISSNVILNVLGHDTVSQTIEFKQHSLAPSQLNKSLRINGNGYKLVANSPKEVLHFNGADHITIKGLTIENTSVKNSLLGVRFTNRADSNTLDSCVIVFSKLAKKGADTGAYIAFTADAGKITRTSSKHAGVGNVIKHNRLYCVLSESPGPFYGIYDKQGSSDFIQKSTHNKIDSNLISTFYSVGILMQYINGEQCRGNIITRESSSYSSSTDTTLIGIFCLEGRSDSFPLRITHNKVEHLPYKNASLSNAKDFIWNLFGVNIWKLTGGKETVLIENNTFTDFIYYHRFHGILSQYSEQVSISSNQFFNISGERGYSYGIYSQFGDDVIIEKNSLRKLDFGSTYSGNGVLIFGNQMGSGTWGENRISGNVLDSNKAFKEFYAIATMLKGNWDISENKVVHNKTVDPKGQTVGIFFYYCVNMNVHDNLLAYNYGPSESYCIYSTNYNTNQGLNVFHNTLYDTVPSNLSHSSALIYLDDDSRTEVRGNIVYGKGSGDVFPMFLNTIVTLGPIADNSIFLNGYSTETWAFEVNQYTGFKDWKRYGCQDSLTYWIPPSFANPSGVDFRSKEYRNQNNVKSFVRSQKDLFGKTRNSVACDRGAVCDSFNLRVLFNLAIPDTVCSGFVLADAIRVINDFSDTVQDVSFTLNQDSTVLVFKRRLNILANDTAVVNLTKPIRLNRWGWNKGYFCISSSNDNTSDDTFYYKVFVKPSPGGSGWFPKFDSTLPNVPVVTNDFDATLCNREIAYSIATPRGFNRTDYGLTKLWYAVAQAYSEGGLPVKGAQITAPTASDDLICSFMTGDTSLEDSYLWLELKIVDISTGCDSLLRRRVYVEPSPFVAFKMDSVVCQEDSISIQNLSELRLGNSYLRYFWEMGNSDTSSEFNPSFLLKDTGLFSVILRVKTSPYNFVFYDTQYIQVHASPDISFTKGIACEGRSVVFKNTSLSKGADFLWNFGDGNSDTSTNATNVEYRYSKRGNYTVQLEGTEKGCTSVFRMRFNVFEQPVASMICDTVVCAGDEISFKTGTQMKTALFGVRWDFDDKDAFSTQKNTLYTYDTAGLKLIKFLVNSEFGCSDSISGQIRVKPSPRAQFHHEDLCVGKSTKFENITSPIEGSLWQLLWKLNDIDKGGNENFSSNWTDTGDQIVRLRVVLDNGCIDSIEKKIKVLDSIWVDFEFDVLCAGDSVLFISQSEPQSGIDYLWKWGSMDSSTAKDIRLVFDTYDSVSVSVILKTSGNNYCSREIIKEVPVLPRPRTCDFHYTTDYGYAFYGISLNPKDDLGELGGQEGVTYSWDINNTDKFQTKGQAALLKHAFDSDGMYKVAMKAKTDAHGCECQKEYTIIMDRLSINGAELEMRVFPNPVSDDLLYIEGISEIESARLLANNGKIWPLHIQRIGKNSFTCKLPSVSNGIYHIECASLGRVERIKVAVSRP